VVNEPLEILEEAFLRKRWQSSGTQLSRILYNSKFRSALGGPGYAQDDLIPHVILLLWRAMREVMTPHRDADY
jgi:hypothetical protein